MQLSGIGFTPAYKQFMRLGLSNPNMTIVEYLNLQRGYRIYAREAATC